MIEAVIVMAKRTPIGRMGGLLSTFEPEALLAPLIQHIVAETNLPVDMIDDVIIGNVVGPGGNIARVAALERDCLFLFRALLWIGSAVLG